VVRSIVRDSRTRDYRFSTLVLGVVHSVPFQMRTAGDQDLHNVAGGLSGSGGAIGDVHQ
jgi:hypothetical protein